MLAMLASTLGCQETITVKGTTRKKPPTETPETSTFQKEDLEISPSSSSSLYLFVSPGVESIVTC